MGKGGQVKGQEITMMYNTDVVYVTEEQTKSNKFSVNKLVFVLITIAYVAIMLAVDFTFVKYLTNSATGMEVVTAEIKDIIVARELSFDGMYKESELYSYVIFDIPDKGTRVYRVLQRDNEFHIGDTTELYVNSDKLLYSRDETEYKTIIIGIIFITMILLTVCSVLYGVVSSLILMTKASKRLMLSFIVVMLITTLLFVICFI